MTITIIMQVGLRQWNCARAVVTAYLTVGEHRHKPSIRGVTVESSPWAVTCLHWIQLEDHRAGRAAVYTHSRKHD